MIRLLFTFTFSTYVFICNAQEQFAKILIETYPGIVIGYHQNRIYFKDGTSLIYDDKIHKNFNALLDNPDVEDQFYYPYSKGNIPKEINRNFDPGRIRNEQFFKKVYGNSQSEVENNLVEIIWCPKLVGKKLKITSVNGVDKALLKVSNELDNYPELKSYLINVGGTFNWRFIKGTKRLSTHSFGMTIDINTKYSNYWQWECNCTNEEASVKYKNRIPQLIINVFEKYGFIWGGKWYHFDTMHFEYRPELLK